MPLIFSIINNPMCTTCLMYHYHVQIDVQQKLCCCEVVFAYSVVSCDDQFFFSLFFAALHYDFTSRLSNETFDIKI